MFRRHQEITLPRYSQQSEVRPLNSAPYAPAEPNAAEV